MKKFFLLLTAALPMMFATSCGDDKKDDPKPEVTLSLDLSSLSLYPEQQQALTPNVEGGVWTVVDDYVAKVSATGLVEAMHVGNTNVKYSVDSKSVKAEVTVVPSNTNFVLPLLNWDASLQQIRDRMSENFKDYDAVNELCNDKQLVYKKNGLLPGYIYTFENNKLTSSSLLVDVDQALDQEILDYLAQYYVEAPENQLPEGTDFFYYNAYNLDDATVYVTGYIDSDDNTIQFIWT